MAMKLRHSHVAVRKGITTLASNVGSPLFSGEDDLDVYDYFEVEIVHEDGKKQRIRFASHRGDRMTHVLAEDIGAVSDLAAALFAVGIRTKTVISISKNPVGEPLRNLDEIYERISAMQSKTGQDNNLTVKAGHNGRHPVLATITLH